MDVRRRCLPAGWYPGTAQGVRDTVRAWAIPDAGRRTAVAGVAPHAGWEFSGALAGAVFAGLSGDLDTIVIIGGHLAAADGILCAPEESYETPLGVAPADLELLARLRQLVPMADDHRADNTVEVQLPLCRYFHPDARCLALRAPPSALAGDLGRAVASAAGALRRRVGVVGSTDLTHYGPNYGFAPSGAGDEAERWVRDVNDRRFIDALTAMDERRRAGPRPARALRLLGGRCDRGDGVRAGAGSDPGRTDRLPDEPRGAPRRFIRGLRRRRLPSGSAETRASAHPRAPSSNGALSAEASVAMPGRSGRSVCQPSRAS